MEKKPQRARPGLLSFRVEGEAARWSPSAPPPPLRNPAPARRDPADAPRPQCAFRPPARAPPPPRSETRLPVCGRRPSRVAEGMRARPRPGLPPTASRCQDAGPVPGAPGGGGRRARGAGRGTSHQRPRFPHPAPESPRKAAPKDPSPPGGTYIPGRSSPVLPHGGGICVDWCPASGFRCAPGALIRAGFSWEKLRRRFTVPLPSLARPPPPKIQGRAYSRAPPVL